MRSTWFSRAARAACVLTLLAATVVTTVVAAPGPERPRRRATNLFAVTNAVLNVNRVFCGINNLGELCVDPTNSPILGGGFWPKGTPDQYIFNSGLQLAGIIDAGAGGGEATFPWAGDTVGAFFFDARGTQVQGDAVTLVYNSLDAADALAWPAAAFVNDTLLYHPVLTRRADAGAVAGDGSGVAISQQDLWTRAWDGNPGLLSGRSHPMGILVEERGLAWNFPTGNEDIIYFVFTFYNITANDCAVYDDLFPHVADAGRRAALQNEVCTVGQNFQTRNEAVFSSVEIPDSGYAIGNLFAAFSMDPDVGDAGVNYSTAILPFNMGIAYKADFLEPDWAFPPDIFGAPFAASPGFVGVKYLKSPVGAGGGEVGLTMFSNTRNTGGGVPDPTGVIQLFRYLSGNQSPAAGDVPCTVADPQFRKLCFLDQAFGDTRFFQASGPFVLGPGEAQTIVVGYVHAAPVAAPLLATGEIGGDLKPGIPAPGDTIFADPTRIRDLERIAGWVSQGDSNGNNIIEQNEVTTVPRSLLGKALVAQAVFDNRFLLPFAPEDPEFFLVPGNNQVAITWRPSPTEEVRPGGGDPFFAIASEPTVLDSLGNPTPNPLYDPNFRQYDVEGYRIYRGRTTSDLQLIAQFDYAGRQIIDFTGTFAYTTDLNGNGLAECAPELGGIHDDPPPTGDCPQAFPSVTGEPHDIIHNVIQVPAGGRVRLANGSVLMVRSDTAVTGGGSGFFELEDTGVPFAFVDTDVRNSFTYHYAVTAFDINSLKSGPSSLESPRITKSVTPRKGSPTEVVASLISGIFGDDNVQLDPNAPFNIDPATGRFLQRPPPTNALVGAFAPLVPQLLPQLNLVARIDSLRVRTDADGGCPVSNGLAACYLIDVTFTKDGVPQQFTINEPWPVWTSFDGITNIVASLGAVPIAADSVSVERFGIPQGFSNFNATVTATLREYIRFSSLEGQAARRGLNAGAANAGFSPGGSRWFNDTSSTEGVNHPGLGIRVGHLTGVDTVWAPVHHTDTDVNTAGVQQYANSGELQCFTYAFGGLSRNADVQITWGAGGQITEVRDLTHHVDVLFKPTYQASYGFVGDFNGNGYIDIRDFNYEEWASQYFNNATQPAGLACNHVDPGPAGRRALLAQPTLLPVSVEAAPTAGTGTGFGLYINGERYIFRLTGGTPPAAGTVWTLRTYAGLVRSTTATIAGPNPAGYTYAATDRNPIIPGLEVRFIVSQPTQLVANTDSMMNLVHTVPDPYYVTNSLEITPNTKVLKFVNMPNQAIIRIYSVSGVLVQVLTHNDATNGGEATWNLRNRNNQFVASGVYFYHVEAPDGKSKVGRFTVVNFAQ
jgi:hypothetical protein